jgi:hypothetical protein
VQSAMVGTTDSAGWLEFSGEHFSWYHDGQHRELSRADTGRQGVVDASAFGQLLVDECVASVHGRYPNDNVEAGELPGPTDAYYLEPYEFAPVVLEHHRELISLSSMQRVLQPLVSNAELAHGIFCYEYQSCEHAAWPTSEAHTICRALKDRILRHLPGADEAPWGWD